MLARIQWIGRQPLVSGIVSSMVACRKLTSGPAFGSEANGFSQLRGARYDSTGTVLCQRPVTGIPPSRRTTCRPIDAGYTCDHRCRRETRNLS